MNTRNVQACGTHRAAHPPHCMLSSTSPGFASTKAWEARVDNWLAEHGGAVEDYAFFTFSTRYAFGYLVYQRDNFQQVGLITNLDA